MKKAYEHDFGMMTICIQQLSFGVSSAFYERIMNESFYLHSFNLMCRMGQTFDINLPENVGKIFDKFVKYRDGKKVKITPKDRDRVYNWINEQIGTSDSPSTTGSGKA